MGVKKSPTKKRQSSLARSFFWFSAITKTWSTKGFFLLFGEHENVVNQRFYFWEFFFKHNKNLVRTNHFFLRRPKYPTLSLCPFSLPFEKKEKPQERRRKDEMAYHHFFRAKETRLKPEDVVTTNFRGEELALRDEGLAWLVHWAIGTESCKNPKRWKKNDRRGAGLRRLESGRPHRRPLSREELDVLKAAVRRWVEERRPGSFRPRDPRWWPKTAPELVDILPSEPPKNDEGEAGAAPARKETTTTTH